MAIWFCLLATKHRQWSRNYIRVPLSENGQSVWVKRAWSQESQVRRFLNNLQPESVLVDRFIFSGDAALDAVYYLSSRTMQRLGNIRLGKSYILSYAPGRALQLEAKLSLTEDSYKFDFELLCSVGRCMRPLNPALCYVWWSHFSQSQLCKAGRWRICAS